MFVLAKGGKSWFPPAVETLQVLFTEDRIAHPDMPKVALTLPDTPATHTAKVEAAPQLEAGGLARPKSMLTSTPVSKT